MPMASVTLALQRHDFQSDSKLNTWLFHCFWIKTLVLYTESNTYTGGFQKHCVKRQWFVFLNRIGHEILIQISIRRSLEQFTKQHPLDVGGVDHFGVIEATDGCQDTGSRCWISHRLMIQLTEVFDAKCSLQQQKTTK